MSTSRSLDAFFGRPIPREAMDAPANSELLAIEVNVFPTKRERFVRSQAAEDEHGDDRTILASRGIDKPLRLFQRKRIDFALGLAQVLYVGHRVFRDKLAAFRDREDRPQVARSSC